MDINKCALGKTTEYQSTYNSELLYAIPRSEKRIELGLNPNSPGFYGVDILNAYEVSWLDNNGKPRVVIAEIFISSDSKCIIESKSLKLYFNSFNNTKFESTKIVQGIIHRDITNLAEGVVNVLLRELNESAVISVMEGKNIDNIEASFDDYDSVNKKYITFGSKEVEDTLSSNLLKSNCLITNQPDWGSIMVKYKGKEINKESFLRYLVSFRNHNEFHEQCVERIFNDINTVINPCHLTVYARYTRRGGIDICPFRTSKQNYVTPDNLRTIRQ